MMFSELSPLDKRQKTLKLSPVIIKKKIKKNYDNKID